MTRDPFPTWAGAFARSALDDPGILFGANTRRAWRALPSDEARSKVLDWIAFFASFHGHEPGTRRARPSELHKDLAALARKLHRTAHELKIAPQYGRNAAEAFGITAENLDAAARLLEDVARRKPYRAAPRVRADFTLGLSAQIKATTGRLHDATVATLASVLFPGEAMGPDAVKALRRRCQK